MDLWIENKSWAKSLKDVRREATKTRVAESQQNILEIES